jgi:hypothetical protein
MQSDEEAGVLTRHVSGGAGQMKDDRMAKIPRQGVDGFVGRAGARAVADRSDPIAMGLQQIFGDIANEPIPDEFMRLLDRIDANERTQQDAASVAAPAAVDREIG